MVRKRRESNGDPGTHSATSSFASNELRRKGAPLRQCGRASLLVDLPGDEMPLLIEMVVDRLSLARVDHEGEVLEALVTARRDKGAALKLSGA